jgi:hypothetical protein
MASIGTTVNSAFDPWAVEDKINETDARYALAGFALPKTGSVMSYKSPGSSPAGLSPGRPWGTRATAACASSSAPRDRPRP